MKRKLKNKLRYIWVNVNDWFHPTVWDNDVAGPGYSSIQELDWGKVAVVLVIIIGILLLFALL